MLVQKMEVALDNGRRMRCVYPTFRQWPMARLLLMKAHWLHKTFSMVGSLLKLMKMWETQHRTRKPRLT